MHEAVRALFGEGRNFPSLTTVMEDGAPYSVALWTCVDGDDIAFVTSRSSRKGRNIARDPRVALSVVDAGNPYRTARVRGAVVGTHDGPEAVEIIERIVRRYMGDAALEKRGSQRMQGLTVYRMRPSYEHFEEVTL